MEGLRISIILIGGFLAGVSTRAFWGSPVSSSEHLVADQACATCSSSCSHSFLSSR